ncbi:MAG: DNA primase [Candidatus Aenigmarchaeota archaeon]|nr:DNA primase [Candidatus Aenigmarchaeota archaeon]
MAKLAQNFAKYVIHARLESSGIVEKPDVIGAVFGQTEGLLGSDMDLRELQRTGRIGRIEVILRVRNGKSEGEILIPSSLDMSETSLIASSLETIDKIGPCDAKITVKNVEDIRSQKRRYIVDRAKEILKSMIEKSGEGSYEISEMIKQAVRTWEISSYHGLSCGPNITNFNEIIVVEGRADVINLLKNGIKNVIAMEGSNVPKAIVNLSKEKIVTAFLDGDRGGDLDLKKLLSIAELDYVARAPDGKEVEDLSQKEIFKALREKLPADQVKKEFGSYMLHQPVNRFVEPKEKTVEKPKIFKKILEDLVGTRAVCLMNNELKMVGKVPLSELQTSINSFKNVYAMVFDGMINQAIVDLALSKKIKYVVGMKFKESVKSNGVIVLSREQL